MTVTEELAALEGWLSQLRSQQLSVSEFSARVRKLPVLRRELPVRYAEVLDSLLDRLESGALFTEESCSFSVTALHDSLALWLEKARAQLTRTV